MRNVYAVRSVLANEDENASLASLTLETTSAGTPFIRKYLHKGLVTITGNITNNLAADEKIRIDFTVTAISQLANTNSFRVLSAANLGDTGVTADDFVATYENDNAVEELRPYILDGSFSIETVGGVKYLVYTLSNKVVISTGADASAVVGGVSAHMRACGDSVLRGDARNSARDHAALPLRRREARQARLER